MNSTWKFPDGEKLEKIFPTIYIYISISIIIHLSIYIVIEILFS